MLFISNKGQNYLHRCDKRNYYNVSTHLIRLLGFVVFIKYKEDDKCNAP